MPAQAGGVVGANGTHATTPSASHPPLLEKEGSKAGPVVLLDDLRLSERVMSSLTIALIVLACVFGGSLLGLYLRVVLPEHHLSEARWVS